MAIETLTFMNEAKIELFAKQILSNANIRISERIVTEVTETSSDKQTASAKVVYALIKALQDADLAASNRVDANRATIESNAAAITSINEGQVTQDNKLTDIETGISELSEVVAGLTHLTIDVVTGDISTVTDPQTDVLYLQRDDETDKTWMLYIYRAPAVEGEAGTWINVGDTEVDLSNYWSKDDTEAMREVLAMHNVEAVSEDAIASAIEKAFESTTVDLSNIEYTDFIITADNRHMIGYTDETTELNIPKTFTYNE